MEVGRKTVGVRELKTRLGTYLREVRRGGTLIVTLRGRPVAEIRPVDLAGTDVDRALGDLVARGVLGGDVRERPALGDFEPAVASGASLAEAVLEDREERF